VRFGRNSGGVIQAIMTATVIILPGIPHSDTKQGNQILLLCTLPLLVHSSSSLLGGHITISSDMGRSIAISFTFVFQGMDGISVSFVLIFKSPK
jgi:hypothetical protein